MSKLVATTGHVAGPPKVQTDCCARAPWRGERQADSCLESDAVQT
eukprot:CAMPEP_0206443690 /NCGR_PEP_ID=MMETSP0324_2-20121206/14503_1 /ASSEMBLY_ACC=CAM_ASM_000836 /TAXON_ID=2866 /ORGANISM="Crypthecodinium cohnii, Strain Seligo" /LENGTH=44 /DNA_ID= /DNA_START= /DNA_END= /DNA_ORIENTATION=